ncbi:DUF975 family protein [Paenibacillus glycinis]|uniref:DUF975 family protein n=1 Tax=Paenibacillus glycinis TaxID=2697035 RepID=A0ABW9XSF6_9BACL|nr:DUF975 family protein [Paenibacillus glycinis]NBD25595.1 DUF975 family protein [Paenibacillus glycinis]
MVSRSELRARARQSLSGQWGRSALFMLVFLLIGAITNVIPAIGQIAIEICAGALAFGSYSFFLRISRGERPPFVELLSGFPDFIRTFLLYLLMLVFTLLWMLLFIVPGFIAALRYSMAYFILKDNPEISALEAIRRSKEMMKGHKGRLFVLFLSFIGWMLLCFVTFGIGILWLNPYIYTTMAHFYEDLRQRGESFYGAYAQVPPPPPHSF